MQSTRLSLIFTFVLVLIALVAVGPSVFADSPPEKDTPSVSPLLQQFIEQREDTPVQGSQQSDSGAVTRSPFSGDQTGKNTADTTSSSSSDGSDDPVRFDSSGNVQVYIHLDNTGDGTLQQLRDLGADIEITNSDANIVQAWVPTTALDAIAALDAVDEITAPDLRPDQDRPRQHRGRRHTPRRPRTGLQRAGRQRRQGRRHLRRRGLLDFR